MLAKAYTWYPTRSNRRVGGWNILLKNILFFSITNILFVAEIVSGGFWGIPTVSLYIEDSVSFKTDALTLKVKVKPDGCNNTDTKKIQLLDFKQEGWTNGNLFDPRVYNLTQIDCYKFTLAHGKKELSFTTFSPTSLAKSCDMSRFEFGLKGVTDLSLNKPNGPRPSTTKGKRCNYDRRGKPYPPEHPHPNMKSNPMYMIIYVLVGIVVIMILWALCFFVGFKILKGPRTTLIRELKMTPRISRLRRGAEGDDVDDPQRNRPTAPPHQHHPHSSRSSSVSSSSVGDHIRDANPVSLRPQTNNSRPGVDLAVVTVHEMAMGEPRHNGQGYHPKDGASYHAQDKGNGSNGMSYKPPNYNDLYPSYAQ